MLSRLAAREALVPNGPGRAGAGAAKKQTSHGFPGSSRAFLACSRLAHLSEFLSTFRQRIRPAAKESGALAPGGLGWRWEARLPERKEKSISAIAPGPETRRDAQCQRLAPKRERSDRLGGRTLQTNPVFLARLWGSEGKESRLQGRRPGLDPWIGKIPWRRAWQPTPVFLPGESPWTEEPGGLHPPGRKESDTTEQLRLSCRSHPRSSLVSGPSPQPPAQGLTHGGAW